MRTNFDQKLEEVHRKLLEMGVLVERNISYAVQAFIDHDVDLARKVIEGDLRVNEMQKNIDRECEEIIALEQPNTTDLRRVIASLRTSSNLERMGDHAENISDITISIEDKKRKPEREVMIEEMANIVKDMTKAIIDAFIDFDVDAAREIAERDKKVDVLYHEMRNATIEDFRKASDDASVAVDYQFVAMHLERIGDYVKNISEGIIYLDTGKITDL